MLRNHLKGGEDVDIYIITNGNKFKMYFNKPNIYGDFQQTQLKQN